MFHIFFCHIADRTSFQLILPVLNWFFCEESLSPPGYLSDGQLGKYAVRLKTGSGGMREDVVDCSRLLGA